MIITTKNDVFGTDSSSALKLESDELPQAAEPAQGTEQRPPKKKAGRPRKSDAIVSTKAGARDSISPNSPKVYVRTATKIELSNLRRYISFKEKRDTTDSDVIDILIDLYRQTYKI